MLIVTIFLTASFMAIHFSIWFLDRPKASPGKTATAMVIAFILTNIASYAGVPREVWGEWVLPFVAIVVSLGLVFRLKPLHLVTVTGCYLTSRLAITALLSFVPMEWLYA